MRGGPSTIRMSIGKKAGRAARTIRRPSGASRGLHSFARRAPFMVKEAICARTRPTLIRSVIRRPTQDVP